MCSHSWVRTPQIASMKLRFSFLSFFIFAFLHSCISVFLLSVASGCELRVVAMMLCMLHDVVDVGGVGDVGDGVMVWCCECFAISVFSFVVFGAPLRAVGCGLWIRPWFPVSRMS